MRPSALSRILLTAASIALFVGCSAELRERVLSVIFDKDDSPTPPTRRVRRDLLQEIDELKREIEEARRQRDEAQEASRAGQAGRAGDGKALALEKTKSWEEVAQALPKAKSGNVDWVQAIKAGSIRPRAGIDAGTPDQAALELDVELTTSKKLYFSVFSHGAHTRWLTCANCHPTIFPLRQAKPTAITMAKIQAGQYCGVCHGKVAFSVGADCSRCHKDPAGSVVEWKPSEPRKPIEQAKNWDEAAKTLPAADGIVDWVKALAQGVIAPRAGIDPKAEDQPVFPLDVERVPAMGDTFKAVFSHQSHTEVLGCPSCHTAIFEMTKGAAPITMEKINAGEYCGACHGKVAFAPSACGKCHPGLAGGK